MGYEQQWHDERRNEVASTQVTGLESSGVALVEGMKKVRGTPDVEHPNKKRSCSGMQACQADQCERGSHDIAVSSRLGEGGRQIGRDHARYQECQTNEAKAV